jgi:hypothetical protein
MHPALPDLLDVATGCRRTFRGGVFKCQRQPVADAIDAGVYGTWEPSAAEQARLGQIFPAGVCDFSKPDVGRPGS